MLFIVRSARAQAVFPGTGVELECRHIIYCVEDEVSSRARKKRRKAQQQVCGKRPLAVTVAAEVKAVGVGQQQLQ